MKFKRFITSINSHFEELVNRMENHEAVAQSAINDVRKHAAKLKIQLKQTQVKISQLEAQKLELERSSALWRNRAKIEAAKDKNKALRCVQALKNTEASLIILDEQIQSSKYLENDLHQHLLSAEQKLSDLSTKKSQLLARASKISVDQSSRHGFFDDLEHDNIFVRWEERILADEYQTSVDINANADLERDYKIEENKVELEMELEALLTEEHAKGEAW